MNHSRFVRSLLAMLLLGLAPTVSAQWITQTNSLRPGWNAVYLHVDPSHTNINGLVGVADPIEEIWLWNADLPPSQALVEPQSPVPGSQWSTWTRALGLGSELQTLRGNVAMLVRVSEVSAGFEWRVKGRPVAPSFRWTLSGLNLVGFPAANNPAPFYDVFLGQDAQAINWGQDAEIFRYQGGSLGTTNPIVVPAISYRLTQVRRDQAYWIRTGDLYNQYFGPFQVSGPGPNGLRFGDTIGSYRLVLKNVAKTNVTVTLRQVASETPPTGQPAAVGTLLPLLVRGSVNTTNLTFGYSNLGPAGVSWTLTPKGSIGSEVEVVIGVNRSQLTGAPGSLYAGVLRFTDSFGLTRIDLAASATSPSRTGLWVGNASVEYVSQYLKPYAKAESQSAFEALLARLQLTQGPRGSTTAYHYEWDPVSGRILVSGGPDRRAGSYLLDGPIKLDSGGVARPYPLRLIVHNTGSSAALLQRAYVGLSQATSNQVVATREEALLGSQLASARRISCTHLPSSDGNTPWLFNGAMQEGTTISTTVELAHNDQASNPFLHTFHPDHDNLDAQFENELPAGFESYGVRRVVSLQFTPPEDNFDSLTRSSGTMGGNYAETMTFTHWFGNAKQFNVLGRFTLRRVTDIPTLTQQ